MAISGKVGAVFAQTATAPGAFVDAATTANATYTRYTITDATKRYLDKSQSITVKKNGVAQTTGFTVENPGGVVVFSAPLLATDVVTVSGSALTVAQAGGFFTWSLEPEQDLQDVTTFASGGWKENELTLRGFKGSAEAFWGNGDFFNRLGQEVVVVLYVDSGASKNRYEGFGIISADGVEANVEDIIKESVEFTGVGQLYYREG